MNTDELNACAIMQFAGARQRLKLARRLQLAQTDVTEIEFTPKATLAERMRSSVGVEGLAEVAHLTLEESK